MASVKDSFLDLERHVLQLEANVKELRAALEHWRTWDAEYEALKEEVTAASQDEAQEAAALSRVHEGFEGDLVNGKEVAEIFGKGRTASQVLGVLGRRLDYVGTNVRTLERKVEEAEKKADSARVLMDPGATDEAGLPITEIFESLDEEGNVLSHELWTPGSKRPQVEEILGKAGVANGSARKAEVEEVQSDAGLDGSKKQDELPTAKSPPAPVAKPAASTRKDSTPTIQEKEKKVITQVEADQAPGPSEQPEISQAAQRVQRIMDNAREQEDLSKNEPVIPADESEEDAELRRQMLDYGMSHSAGGMGEVVAVMNDLRFEDSDDDEEFNSFSDVDEDDDDEDEVEEDRWGRSTGRVVSERYQDRMLELEQRLGVQSRFTRKLAEEATAEDDDMEEGIGKITINDTGASKAPPKKSARDMEPPANGALKSDDTPKAKKSVRFAGSLDVAPEAEPKPAPKPEVQRTPKHLETENPVADLIVEQTTPQKPAPAPETKPRKPSRFKQMKGAVPKPAAKEQERKPSEESGIMNDLAWTETAPEKDLEGDVDGEIERREVADEYQRRRRRMIEREGGFLKEDESEVQRDDARPVSKFRAARLSRQ